MRLLTAVLIVAAACSILHAISRPFWNDEILTAIVADQPTARDMWNALADAADTNPPAFYAAARVARMLVPDDHLAYRLPSIAGLLGAIVCVFLFLARRVPRLAAIVGATFLLVTPLNEYAYEARPYALMIACLAAAMVCWQRADDSKWFALPLALALAASVSVHYFAAFVIPVFVIAEAAAWVRGRLRVHVWLAIAAAAIPLVVFAPLLVGLRRFYGHDYWARTSLAQALVAHDWLFFNRAHWGSMLMAGLSIALLCWMSSQRWFSGPSTERTPIVPAHDYVLILMFLWTPAIVVVLALVSDAGLTDRHFLPATLGGAVAVGFLVARLRPAVRATLLVLFLSSYMYSSHRQMASAWRGTLLDQRHARTSEVEQIVKASAGVDGPLVISPALDYLEAAYFASSSDRSRLHWLADPAAAARLTGANTPDLALTRLQHWFPLHVDEYAEFAAGHSDFVLVGGTLNSNDWWPMRLLQDGYRLELRSFASGRPIYRVTLRH